jgi:hypothetical protein
MITLSGVAAVTLSGCLGSAGTPSESGGGDTLLPINQEQAKDAMALNAIAYRIITPAYALVTGLISTSMTSRMTTVPSYESCDEGTFTRTETENGLVFEYDNCKTNTPNNGFQDPMISECLDIGGSIFPGFIPTNQENTLDTADSYYAIINGKVTCETTGDTAAYAKLENYEVTAYNSTVQKPAGDNRWVYNMRIDLSYELYNNEAGNIPNALYTLKVDGDFRGQKWDGSSDGTGTLVNDETWTFNNLTLEGDHQGVGQPDIIRAFGSASYVGSVREGDEDHNGIELSVAFDKYAYQFDPTDNNTRIIENIKISGKVQASCHPDWVTYMTPEVLIDQGGLLNGLKDAENDRMPHSGKMTIATESTTGEAEALFTDNGNNAEVTITTEDGSHTYESWRSIIDGSSCQVFQEIIDRIDLGTLLPSP